MGLRKAAEHLHDLRHQFTSFLLNDGKALYEAQQILGLSDPKVTMRYAHLSTKSLREAANSAAVKIQRYGIKGAFDGTLFFNL